MNKIECTYLSVMIWIAFCWALCKIRLLYWFEIYVTIWLKYYMPNHDCIMINHVISVWYIYSPSFYSKQIWQVKVKIMRRSRNTLWSISLLSSNKVKLFRFHVYVYLYSYSAIWSIHIYCLLENVLYQILVGKHNCAEISSL